MTKKRNGKKSPDKKSRKKTGSLARKGLSGSFQIIGISLLFGCGLFALVTALEKISVSDMFQVNQIKWLGLKHLKEDEILKGYEPVVGKNIFEVDIKAVHRRLLLNPRIKAATVKKDFPNRLLIIVEEKQPAAALFESDASPENMIQLAASVVILDAEAKVLQTGIDFEKDLPSGLPRLFHFKEAAYANALALGKVLKARAGLLIDLDDPNDLVVYLTEGEAGTQLSLLHFGRGNFEARWQRFLAIEDDLKMRGLVEWEIDLRFPGQAVVKNGILQKPFVSGRSSDTIYF